MATDLKKRERAVADDPNEEVRRKEKMKADELKKEIAEFQSRRLKKTFGPQNRKENVEGETAGSILNKERILKVTWETSAGDYSAANLREIFERFGIVDDVVIRSNSSKKKASAIIVMASKGAMVRALQSMSGDTTITLLVLPLVPIAPSFSSTSSTHQNESMGMGPEFNNVVGAGFQKYEAFVMKKLQEQVFVS